jgi:hypothetical protein
MVEILLCSLIAQQCLVLASFSFTGLFIDEDAPRAAGESNYHVMWKPVVCARLKATT